MNIPEQNVHTMPAAYIFLFLCMLNNIFLKFNIQAQPLVRLPKGVIIPAILAFGDSIIDPGNNNALLTPGKANFPPYGRDLNAPTGRFSNGKIPTDLIVEVLGIKELLPAYLDPDTKPDDLLTGVSFASGGAGYDPITTKLASAIGVSEQLDLFKEYIGKLKTYVGEARTASILSNSGYLVVFGSDDIANTYYGPLPVRNLHYDINGYTDFMIQLASTFLQELYDLGARRIVVFSTPPIGCVPSQRTVQGGILRECVAKQNDAAIMFNSKLYSTLQEFNKRNEVGRSVYVDIYNPLLDIVTNPYSYGFQVANKGCCGTGLIEVTPLCNSLSVTCQNVSDYVFWDSFHPTQRAYEILFYSLADKIFHLMFP